MICPHPFEADFAGFSRIIDECRQFSSIDLTVRPPLLLPFANVVYHSAGSADAAITLAAPHSLDSSELILLPLFVRLRHLGRRVYRTAHPFFRGSTNHSPRSADSAFESVGKRE